MKTPYSLAADGFNQVLFSFHPRDACIPYILNHGQ